MWILPELVYSEVRQEVKTARNGAAIGQFAEAPNPRKLGSTDNHDGRVQPFASEVV
jgi:hypothetical protein